MYIYTCIYITLYCIHIYSKLHAIYKILYAIYSILKHMYSILYAIDCILNTYIVYIQYMYTIYCNLYMQYTMY